MEREEILTNSRNGANLGTNYHHNNSMAGILRPDINTRTTHFTDSIDRFTRDFAAIEKKQVQQKRYQQAVNRQHRTQNQLQKLIAIKQNQLFTYEKQNYLQKKSQELHLLGLKKNAHSSGTPVDLITLNYHNNLRGQQQKQIDRNENIKRLVRSHNIIKHNSCGYNVINGVPLQRIQDVISTDDKPIFYEKVNNLEDHTTIRPWQWQDRNLRG